MTLHVPIVHTQATLADIKTLLETSAQEFETVNYIYVVDERSCLQGILSIKDVFRLQASVRVGNVCRTDHLVTVYPEVHQERAAYLALKHNIKAIPVVDHDGTLLGIVTSDEILHILYHETHEDMLRLAGVHRHGKDLSDNVLTLSLITSIRHRVPWLFLGLLGGLLAEQLIGSFEHVLMEHLVLAGFIPLIVYMGGAVSTQMETFIIRDLAIQSHLPYFKYFYRQLFITTLIGLALGGLLTLAGAFIYNNLYLGVVLGISLTGAVVSSVITGIVIPTLFHHLRMDPANASGPIATILQDLCSILIYFSIASILL